MKTIAIIPARGGSKRIPNKNIRIFCGKPIIGWSIEAAKKSNLFDRIIVSTDSKEIARIAREFGAEIPFMRPKGLADDLTPTRPVINHAIQELGKTSFCPEYVCCLYPTAPFVLSEDLKKAMKILVNNNCQFVFTATSFPSPIQRSFEINHDGRIRMLFPEHKNTRSQDLTKAFHDAGQFYFGRTQAFLDNLLTFSQVSIPLILPLHRVHDIDTQEDWDRAVLFFKTLKYHEVMESV